MAAKTTYASAASMPDMAGCISDNGLFTAPYSKFQWDYRLFGQSVAARRGRMEKRFLRANAWKVPAGIWSKKELRANARNHALWNVSAENTYGAKYLFQSPADGIKVIGFNPN